MLKEMHNSVSPFIKEKRKLFWGFLFQSFAARDAQRGPT